MTAVPARRTAPFQLLSGIFGDAETGEIFSERSTIESWLRVERELARASADVGLISAEEAEAISAAAVYDNIAVDDLWSQTRNVGYPILPLVRQIAAACPPGPDGRVHLGATTQDIMDSALVLQLLEAGARLDRLTGELGDVLVRLMNQHVGTIMPARTHGQHAVPTTFGAKLAVYVTQLTDLDRRLRTTTSDVALVSLHGAGGTSAAWGPLARRLRAAVAQRLGVCGVDVPWHSARQRLVDFGLSCALIASFCGRLAREVITLSRTEIAEVSEPGGWHKGASSTMPQKVNPTLSEATVGMAGVAEALTSALLRCIEAEHERAAGEWQMEWEVLPSLTCLAAGCMVTMTEAVRGLRVDASAMAANLGRDSSLLMAEAYMMRLAGSIGRERAHDAMYELAAESRNSGLSVHDVVAMHARELWPGGDQPRIEPADYLGEPQRLCASAQLSWAACRATPATGDGAAQASQDL